MRPHHLTFGDCFGANPQRRGWSRPGFQISPHLSQRQYVDSSMTLLTVDSFVEPQYGHAVGAVRTAREVMVVAFVCSIDAIPLRRFDGRRARAVFPTSVPYLAHVAVSGERATYTPCPRVGKAAATSE
jgi:hypothetical protein